MQHNTYVDGRVTSAINDGHAHRYVHRFDPSSIEPKSEADRVYGIVDSLYRDELESQSRATTESVRSSWTQRFSFISRIVNALIHHLSDPCGALQSNYREGFERGGRRIGSISTLDGYLNRVVNVEYDPTVDSQQDEAEMFVSAPELTLQQVQQVL